MRRSLIAGVVVAALGAGLAIPASAHNERYKSEITISHPKPELWKGKVKSDIDACIRNRRVTLWIDFDDMPDVPLDEDIRTDSRGKWRTEIFIGEGYYATVKRKVKRPGDHKHVCKGDRSPTVE